MLRPAGLTKTADADELGSATVKKLGSVSVEAWIDGVGREAWAGRWCATFVQLTGFQMISIVVSIACDAVLLTAALVLL